jgi:acyl-CoA thioesterase
MKKDSLRYARDIVAADPMATFLGIRLKELRRAYACLSLDIRPEYLNSLGRAHGMASPALIAEIKVHFLDAVHPGDTVTAEAKAIDIKNTLSLWQVDVRDSSGKLVAAGQALGYHRPPEE